MLKLPVMVFIATIIVASSVMLTVPAASALTTRDFSYLNDNHLTARYGDTTVCGDHICAPGEWDQLQSSLNNAQRGQQAGWTATHPVAATNSTTTSEYQSYTSSSSTGASNSVCSSIQNMLNNAGVSDKVTAQVLSDLHCS